MCAARTARQRSSFTAGALAGLVLATGCDPCGTTFSCIQSPRVAVVGQIVDETTGRPVTDALVEMRHVGGIALDPPVVGARSRGDGVFELSAEANAVGQSFVNVSVAAPSQRPYVVADIRTNTRGTHGDATVFHPWVSAHPVFPYVIRVVQDTVTGNPVAGATVEFRRTGGRLLFASDAPISVVTGITGPDGFVYLFTGIATDTTGDVIGELVIRLPTPNDSLVLGGTAFTSVPRFHQERFIVNVPVNSPP